MTDAMPALISYLDADQRYRFVNARYVEWFGHAEEDLVGRELRDVLGEEAYERVRPHAESALSGRRSRFEAEIPYRYGGTRRVVAEYVPHTRDDGVVDGFFALVSDITDQRRGEAAQARLATIVETSGDAISSIDLDGTFLTWNAGAETLFGFSPDEAIGRRVEIILPPGRRVEERDILEHVRAGEVVGPYDTVRRTRDGREIDVSVTVSPIRDADGQVVGASKVDRDIADRVATERALRESEKELQIARARERSYLDHLPVGVWFANEEGELVYANSAAKRIWGGARMAGPDEYEVYWHGRDGEARVQSDEWALTRALRGGAATVGEVLDIVALDGTRRTVLNSAVPVRSATGAIAGGVVMNLDISELKKAEAALREADRRKDEFLAALSHELRNPLAAIQSAIQLLAQPDRFGPAHIDRAARTVQRQVATMVRLVDDLLDVGRITRGALELRRQRVELAPLIEDAVASVQTSLDRKGHELEVSLPAQPVEVDGDAVRLVQVLTNVLGNATEYTDQGGRIEIALRSDGDEAVVTIADNGRGIAKDKLESIFEMFTRLDSGGFNPSGLGIGLTLSRQLVEMHEGSLTASSDGEGRGTTIALRLPKATAAQSARTARPVGDPASLSEVVERRRVLVVDDNVDAADLLGLHLEARGYDVRIAYDGRCALEQASGFQPEAVLLDLGLPDLDGLSVCRSLRAQPWGNRIRIVAVSGWGQEADKRRTAEAGFDVHLTKPADIGEVVRVLES